MRFTIAVHCDTKYVCTPPPLLPLPLLKVNKMLLTKKEEIMKQLHVIFSWASISYIP